MRDPRNMLVLALAFAALPISMIEAIALRTRRRDAEDAKDVVRIGRRRVRAASISRLLLSVWQTC